MAPKKKSKYVILYIPQKEKSLSTSKKEVRNIGTCN
jgi:uncharacterized protein YlbG (UPF0298 family)